MNAQELTQRFIAKVAAAAFERDHQVTVAADNRQKRADDAEHCKRAMEQHVIPFLTALKHHLPEDQFSFAPQINLDHKPVGVSFKIGDGAPTTISSALGNVVVARAGASGSSKGVAYVYPPDAEPYISNSGDRALRRRAPGTVQIEAARGKDCPCIPVEVGKTSVRSLERIVKACCYKAF